MIRTIIAGDENYDSFLKSLFELTSIVWPPQEVSIPIDVEAIIASWHEQKAAHFAIFDEENPERLLAHAALSRREVITSSGPLIVGALAAVCVHPDYRGRGWGADVAKAAFDYLPTLGEEVILYQTGVPQFYEKLGARLVDNNFHNGADPKNPFWEPYAMIYPASFVWPEGPVDLNGPGY